MLRKDAYTMDLQILLVTLCVVVPIVQGQADFASLLGSLGFGGGKGRLSEFLLYSVPSFTNSSVANPRFYRECIHCYVNCRILFYFQCCV